jgi:anti-sigma factor RsiW
MTRKTWSTVDVSAYLDGELTPEIQVAFETTVSQDPDLQHRVAEMRQVVSLLRSVPLQELPRNYLLTPSMVTEAEAKPRTQRRRLPLLMMRIATSVAAAAFVVASGLTLMQRGITPTMITQSRGAPEAAIMLGEEATGDELEMLAAPVAQAVPVEEFAEAEWAAPAAPEVEKAVERAVETEEEEVVPEAPAEPALSMQDTENIEEPGVAEEEVPALELGVGGGVEEPAPEGDADSAEETAEVTDAADSMTAGVSVESGTPTPQEEAMQAETETAPTEAAAAEAVAEREESIAAEAPMPPVETAGEMTAGDDAETATRAMPEDDQALGMAGEAIEATAATPGDTDAIPALRTSIGLGVVTAALAGITFWMSRRQLD